MKNTVLAVDIGTTSLKAGLISEDGEVVAFSAKTFKNPDDRYIALQWLSALKDAFSEMHVKTNVCGVCVSGNGPTIVCENGLTVRWNENLESKIDDTHSLFIPKILLLKQNFSEHFEKTRWLLSGPEYLIYELCGTAVTVLPEKRYEAAYWNEHELCRFDIPSEKMPPFVETGHNCGLLTEKMSAYLGFNQPVPVFASGPDFIAAMIGTNTLSEEKLCDCAGSSEGFNYCSSKIVHADGVRTLPSVIPGLWNIAVLNQESGRLFVDYKAVYEKETGHAATFAELFDYSLENKESRGNEIVRQILNQVSGGVNLLCKVLFANGLSMPEYITVTGGQAKNDRWMQTKSDYLGIKLVRCNCADSEFIGDAVVWLYGSGKYNSLKEAADKIVRIEKVFAPQE